MALGGVKMIEVPEETLRELYGELQELQARGAHRAAVDHAINFLFDELGEPGTYDE